MRKLFISLCFSACCSLLAAQTTNPIQEAMANYDYETALMLIDQETPTVPLLYQKGKALKGLGNNLEALSVFQEVVAQDSLNPRAYIEAAECCKSLAKYSEALDYYQNALHINPDNKYARIQYISLLMNMKRYRESLKESNLLAERDSSAYVLHLRAESMGQVYDNTEIMHVIDAYLDIQKRYPNDYLSAAKLGNIYVAGHQYEDAINITEKYRSIDSTNVLVNRINAQAYCLNKDYPKAIERYEQLLQEKDSSFQTCFYAGISYYALEDFYPSLNHICINAYSMRISFFYPCFSVLDQSSRKSYILIICMPFSSLHCLVCSPTISSLRKESSTRRNDRFSCSIFSASGIRHADWM